MEEKTLVNVIEMVQKGHEDKTLAYVCGKCRHAHYPQTFMAKSEIQHQTARRFAEKCCIANICKRCEKPITGKKQRFHLVCPTCRHKVNTDHAITHETLPDGYENMLYFDDEWYDDFDTFFDRNEGLERPDQVYLTKKRYWQGFSIEDYMASSLEEFVPDDEYSFNMNSYLEGYEDLLAAVEQFNSLNKGKVFTYEVDYKNAVKVPDPACT
jgi:hypothetical protein